MKLTLNEPVTTFRLLHDAGACITRYRYLAKKLGGINEYGRKTPITLTQILTANGVEDAIWALRACPDSDRFARHLACDFAEDVLPIFERQYPNDDRPRKCIEVVRRYADGNATTSERAAAEAAAGAAAWAAAEAAAEAAAWAAAGDAAGAAARAAVGAARAAAGAAAGDAAGDAARDAAGDAARARQVEIMRSALAFAKARTALHRARKNS